MAIEVYIETGKKRSFACAVDWPGWCRAGKDEAAALKLLGATAPRFERVASEAGLEFPGESAEFRVIEHVEGSVTTDFGSPAAIAAVDRRGFEAEEAMRSVALLRDSWALLDAAAAAAPGGLRKGPRGGGRDRDPMIEHVVGSEYAYGRKIGIGGRPADLRALLLERLGEDFEAPAKGWPGRYAARRLVWYVVDHIGEIEDRGD